MAKREPFGARLDRLRQKSGLSHADLARAIGASGRDTVHSWATGRCVPAARWIEPLAESLGVTVGDLLIGATWPE